MRRLGIGLVGVAALASCTPPAPARSVSLAGGDIIASSPAGYCVDMATSRPQDDFALLAPCTTLGAVDDLPEVIGVVTVQVGPQDSGLIAKDEIALRDFLITETGNQLLSRSGSAGDIRILSTQAFSDQVMVHFTDAGAPPFRGLQREEWRAFRNVNGRLVTIAVRGLARAPLRDGPGAALLKLVVAGVQATGTAAASAPEPDA